MDEIKRACKGSSCIAYCEHLINEIDPHQDLSRSAVFSRAVEKAVKNTAEDWTGRAKELKKFKNCIPEGIAVPTALQVRVENELADTLLQVEEDIKTALDLTNLQTRYEVEILNYNYLECLKRDVLDVGDKSSSSTSMNGPEMVARLVQILLLNRESDRPVIERIKSALAEWKE